MKMFKNLSLLMVSVVLVACSGNSNPVTTPQSVVAVTPTPYNTLNPNGLNGNPNGLGINPYFTANAGAYAQLGFQAQFHLQLGATNLLSCAARATPHFYLYTSSNNNCAVRRQPTYTPNACACVKAPCDCEQVVTQTRTQCLFPPTQTTTISTGCKQSGINENSKILPLTITGADARALYERLAKSPEDLKNDSSTQVRTGMNYKCMMDGNGGDDKDYACDLDVSEADGLVYELFPVAQAGLAVITGDMPYHGKNVIIGGPGFGVNEGSITIEGAPAKVLFGKIKGTTIKSTGGCFAVASEIKVGKTISCSKAQGSNNYSCQVKVNTETGETESPALN